MSGSNSIYTISGSQCPVCHNVQCNCGITFNGNTVTLNSNSASPSFTNVSTATAGYVYMDPGIAIGDYFIQQGEDGELVIKDSNGNICISFKDGIPMIGDQTIHEVILDIIDMVNGTLPLTALLVDPDKSKRALGKKIHERRKKNKVRRKLKCLAD